MRLGIDGTNAPPPHTHCCADEQPASDEGRPESLAPINDDLAARGEQPSSVAEQQGSSVRLIGRITSSWPATWRMVTLLIVFVVLLGGLLLLVPADIELGPIRILPH
ncbi:hypothetical protein [Lentzea sp. NPDC059081]|uniref:hypothetical protein n=1 Tax=Lentzea sp. NPDC059081 TaxID=3346719 RepID=UPI0036CA16C3